jgi:hypothetical protein
VLDLHLGEEGCDLRDKIEVILEEVSFEHGGEVLGDFLSFLRGRRLTWKQLLRLSAISAISGT